MKSLFSDRAIFWILLTLLLSSIMGGYNICTLQVRVHKLEKKVNELELSTSWTLEE